MNCLSTISSSKPCHATPNLTVPLRAGACRTLEGTLVRMFYRLFLVPSRASPNRGRPLLANAGHSAPSLDNTRRMAISNHLSTVASSSPIHTVPDPAEPFRTVPIPTRPNTRRMTVANHLSTISSSTPRPTGPFPTSAGLARPSLTASRRGEPQ